MITGKVATEEALHAKMRDLVPLLVKYEMPGTPAATVAAYEAENLDLAAASLKDHHITITLNLDNSSPSVESGMLRVELERLIPPGLRLVSLYGLAGLYFSWFTSRRSGATPGKRWLGLRVVCLYGKDLGLLASFERFVGYFQIPVSLGTALLDFWRDTNRRLPHDRLSGTIVIRQQREKRAAPKPGSSRSEEEDPGGKGNAGR
jgi:hypothetical protein